VDYQTEDDQIKALKEWWKENGTSIIVGVVIGIGGFTGYNWWKDQKFAKQENASVAYESFVEIDASEKLDEFVTAASSIKSEFGDTGYAVLASLHLAKQYVEKGELDKASSELQWAVEKTKGTHLQPLMQIRLARVLNEQQKLTEAEAILNAISNEAYKGLKHQVLGDVYLAMGEQEKARSAYETARENVDSYIAKNELEMLVNDLATSDLPVASAPSSEEKQDS